MNDQNSSAVATKSNPLVPTLLLLAISGFGYLTLTSALESRRPRSVDTPQLPPPVGAQGFETTFSRLWQDPFSTVYALEAPAGSDRASSSAVWPLRCMLCILAGDCKCMRLSQIAEQAKSRVDAFEKILCMPVLVPGGPYAETREHRRRTRYALLTALGDSGFSLRHPERMTYFTVPIRVQTGPTPERFTDIENFVVPIKIHESKKVVRATGMEAKPKYNAVIVKLFLRGSLKCSRLRFAIELGRRALDYDFGVRNVTT